MVSVADLKGYDFGIAVDRSGSMAEKDQPGNRSRWDAMHEGVTALANKIAEFDDDGIDVLVFNDRVKRYDNVTPDKVEQIWKECDPMGGTDLHLVIKSAADEYLKRKAAGKGKSGYILLVATDGEPSDPRAVEQEIIALSKKLDRDEEFGISFVQVGSDKRATAYLKSLDDDLVSKGAKFDIVDTLTFDEAGDKPLAELLLNALTD